jgi:hydrogenase expression/formation protein HypC
MNAPGRPATGGPAVPAVAAGDGARDLTAPAGGHAVPECYDDICVTCSDTAVPVRILRLLADDLAIVDTGSGEEEVSVALVSAGVGATVLVHAREAIAVVAQ